MKNYRLHFLLILSLVLTSCTDVSEIEDGRIVFTDQTYEYKDNAVGGASNGYSNSGVKTEEEDPEIVLEEHFCEDGVVTNVTRVLSGNLIDLECGSIFRYVGVGLLSDDMQIQERAFKYNEFLVLDRDVILKITGEDIMPDKTIVLLGEVFLDAQSVNLRMLESGLVSIAPLPESFARSELFYKAIDYASLKEQKIIEKDNFKGTKTPVIIVNTKGCGTLPCPPK